jgi:hypothetical protein
MKEFHRRLLLSLLLTLALAAIGWLGDFLDAQWILALPFTVLLFRPGFRPILVCHELVVVLFLSIAAATASGTFTQNSTMYESGWFAGILGLLALNNLLCVILRLSHERRFSSGLVHVSVLLVLTGGLVKTMQKEEGMVNLRIGQTSNLMVEMKGGNSTGKQREMPFPIRLDDFAAEFYESDARLLVFDLDVSRDKPALEMSLEDGSTATVSGRSLRVAGAGKDQVKPAPNHPPVEVDVYQVEIDNVSVPVPSNGKGVTHGSLGLLYHQPQGKPKLFRSTLSVLDDTGQAIETRKVVVNDPLIREGWWLYQANWGRTEEGLYSGIHLVRDPGLPYVFAGMTLLLWGLAVVLLIPRRGRKV